MPLHVGIDFGTSNSGVAVSDGSNVRVLPIDRNNVLPEVVKTILYITRDYKTYIGQEAVEIYYRHNINRQKRFVKKWVGEIDYRGADMHYVRDIYVYEDELKPGRLMQFIKTALRSEGYLGTQIFERYYTLSDIIAVYLGELKRRAEALLHEPIHEVTLGRPVRFSNKAEVDQQAQQTLYQAAMEAGFRKVCFELEPVAAAHYYEQSLDHPQNVLIFDFGGGTLDLTILRLGDPKQREVYANNGIGIAGSDFDRAIIEKRMLPHFGKGRANLDPSLLELVDAVGDWIALPDLSTPQTRLKLEKAILEGQSPARLKSLETLIFNDLAFSFYNNVEASKIALSSQGATVMSLRDRNIDLWELYTRAQFEHDIRQHQEQIEQVIVETVAASGLEADQIDAVVKTGGSSNIPAFTRMLARHFSPQRIQASDLFSSVTAGLALSVNSTR